jgi:hypothetical protein
VVGSGQGVCGAIPAPKHLQVMSER